MPKQNTAVEKQPAKQPQPKVKPETTPAGPETQGPLPEPGLDLLGAAGDSDSQAALLADPRFQTAQRQGMASQIGGIGGNRSLQRLLNRLPAGQRRDDSPSDVQRTTDPAVIRGLQIRLPVMQAQARVLDAYYNVLDGYVNLAVADADLLKTKLAIFSINYDMAYSRYSSVIGAGRAEAQNQTLWRGIFLGIATGVLAGLAAAYIAPSTAAGWLTLTLADAATAAGSSCLQAIFSAGVAYVLSDALTVSGSDLQPGGLSPDVLRTQIWQHLANMYRGAVQTNRVMTNLHRNSVGVERLVAEMRVAIAGGTSQFPAEDVLGGAVAMERRLDGMQPALRGIDEKVAALRAFGSSVAGYDPNQPPIDQMERDIWLMWMGTLNYADSDILDLDAIEDHLLSLGIIGPSSTLGVDFGDYTSEEDEIAAIAAARPQARSIRQRYETEAARWSEPTL